MRKFNEVYKEKQRLVEEHYEQRVLRDFENIYSSLLEKYNVNDFYRLNENEQESFLTEVHNYWNEEEGITKKGKSFLTEESDMLNENSTPNQKKNFLSKRASNVINETLRQSGLKYALYDIIDEMYNEVKATDISEVLSPKEIVSVIKEEIQKNASSFLNNIKKELSDSVNLYEREFSEEEREELAKKGYALPDGSFPIVNKKDLENAIKAFGRGDQPKKEKAHIIKRAKALGEYDLIPDKWKN
jgi:hypothetical protein